MLIESAIEKLAAARRIQLDDDAVYLVALYEAERAAAEQVKRMLETPAPSIEGPLDLSAIEREQRIELAPEQRAAVEAAMTRRLLVVTGGPGTGKTTIVKAIIRLQKRYRRKVLLAAPTGRAAKRLSEATGEEAKTIHRLLEFDPEGARVREERRRSPRGRHADRR